MSVPIAIDVGMGGTPYKDLWAYRYGGPRVPSAHQPRPALAAEDVVAQEGGAAGRAGREDDLGAALAAERIALLHGSSAGRALRTRGDGPRRRRGRSCQRGGGRRMDRRRWG